MTYNVFSGTLSPTHSLTRCGMGKGTWLVKKIWATFPVGSVV